MTKPGIQAYDSEAVVFHPLDVEDVMNQGQDDTASKTESEFGNSELAVEDTDEYEFDNLRAVPDDRYHPLILSATTGLDVESSLEALERLEEIYAGGKRTGGPGLDMFDRGVKSAPKRVHNVRGDHGC